MAVNLTLQDFAIPLLLLLSYLLLAIFVTARRGLRGREPAFFVIHLVIAIAGFLSLTRGGFRVIWGGVPWELLGAYLLIGIGFTFWSFTRAFLQKSPLAIGGWLPALLIVLALIALDAGFVTLPAVSLAPFSDASLAYLVATLTLVVYLVATLVTVLVEYARRPSPLHRNRILYWLLSTAILVVGLALVLSRREIAELGGIVVHLVGAILMTYIVVQPQLPGIATGIWRFLSYVLTTLIPAAIAAGLSLGLIYVLSLSPLFRLQLNEDTLFGVAITGLIAFLLYWPLATLTRRATNRLFFGRGYGVERVVGEYSQAISRTINLEALTATATRIIDGALGIRRGTLLTVQEKSDDGWRLRVIEGIDVPAGQPDLMLQPDTPLADWLVRQGKPLHQYTMDVAPQFDSLADETREIWHRLGMELLVPIRRSDNLIGLLALGVRKASRSYSGDDISLLATLADQTAVALENASLFDRIQRRAEQLALLNEIGQVITTSIEMDEALGLIAQRIKEAFKGATGFIFLLDDGQTQLTLQSAFGQARPGSGVFQARIDQGLIGAVAATGKSVLVTDLPEHHRYDASVEGKLVPGAKLALCVPVLAKDRVIGVILVVDPAQKNIGREELDLLSSIASFASIAIENARQVAAREARLREQLQTLQIQVDELKRAQEVELITESEYFRRLKAEAGELRDRRREREATPSERIRRELAKRPKAEGVTPADIAELSNPLRATLNKLLRENGMALDELAASLGLEDENEARQIAELLVEKGFLEPGEKRADDQIFYALHFAHKATRRKIGLPPEVWDALADED